MDILHVLEEEMTHSVDKLSKTDFDSLAHAIRIQIHGFEKGLVKGLYHDVNVETIKSFLKKTQVLIDTYPEYPKDGDLIVETIGMIHGILEIFPDREDIKRILNDFIEKNKLHNVVPRVIRIENINGYSQWNSYDDFVSQRHSVRNYKKEKVEDSLIRDIVKIAVKCPSACNRQPCKVYYTNNFEKIKDLRPDPVISKDIYNFLIVTVNKSMFSLREVLQPWINGGIFIESLILAIHSKGLGACLFQQLKHTNNYEKLKITADIPDNEDIVAVIGFGYIDDNCPVVETHRKDVSEILVEF